MNGYGDWGYSIVPAEYPTSAPTVGRVPTVYTFEDPWWMLGSQAIEAARQAAIVHEGGHPPQPQPAPQPYPLPYPAPSPGVQPRQDSVTVSNNTLIIAALVVGAFIFGGKRGR